MNTKEKLLQELFTAIELRQVAEMEEVYARSELDKAIAKGNRAEILAMAAVRIDRATDLAIAEMRADETYKAYLACLNAEKEASRND